MTVEEFEHVLKQIDPYTNYVYLHVKGEPLLHSHLKEIISLCEKYNKFINITTNGTLLLKRCDDLKSPFVRRINVSLHSNEEEFPNYLEDVVRATNELLKRPNLNIEYRYWTLDNGVLDYRSKKLFERIFNIFDYHGPLEKNIKLKDRLYLNQADQFLWPSFDLPIYEDGTCYGTIDHVAILSDGMVVPCCLDSEGVISFGNVFEESFASIIKKDRFKVMADSFRNRKVVEPFCKHCQFKTTLRVNQNK